MRTLSMVLAAMALLQVAGWAEAKDRTQPGGGGYVDTKHPKLGKNYYVVRMGVGDKCSIVSGEWSNKPAGVLGGAPYASRKYAKAALKTFPECKGGEIEEAADEKD
jgi:hypothetical protein